MFFFVALDKVSLADYGHSKSKQFFALRYSIKLFQLEHNLEHNLSTGIYENNYAIL